jgi:hypothetical protein
MALTPKEIYDHMTELRNLRKLHRVQKVRIQNLETEVRVLKQENQELRTQNATLTDLKLQIEELRTMVFGRKKKETYSDDDILPPPEKIPRSSDSYRRPIPMDAEVTDIQDHPLLSCTHCQGTLTRKKEVTFYEEDIPLPVQKTVEKHIVEKGYCITCAKWSTAMPLPCQRVILGNNVQKYICYLSLICRLSYAQVQQLLKDTFSLNLSQGEIAKILARQALIHRPEYEQLKVRIRGEPCVGLDETGWQIHQAGEHTYAWVMTGMESRESVYLLGENRGGGNVDTLLGNEYQGYVVTDDFAVYKHLSLHQLCWAHLIRKFRDLARSKEILEPAHTSCVEQYTVVAELFADLAKDRDVSQRDSYAQRLRDLAVILPADGLKLQRIKRTLQKNVPLYLTCCADASIPLTNNQSERSLRHLVIKRAISFGSLCKRTAETTAVLLSVLLSRRARNPEGYLREWVGV